MHITHEYQYPATRYLGIHIVAFEERTSLFHVVNIMAAYGLVMPGARALAAIALT